MQNGLGLVRLPSIIPLIVLCQNITVIILVWPYRSHCLSTSRSSSEVVDHVRLALHSVVLVDGDLCNRGDEKKKNYHPLKRYYRLPFFFSFSTTFSSSHFFPLPVLFLSLFLSCLLHPLEVLQNLFTLLPLCLNLRLPALLLPIQFILISRWHLPLVLLRIFGI